MFSASIMLFFPLSALLASFIAFSNLVLPPSFACMEALASIIVIVFSRETSYGIFVYGWATAIDKPVKASSWIKNSRFTRNFLKKSSVDGSS